MIETCICAGRSEREIGRSIETDLAARKTRRISLKILIFNENFLRAVWARTLRASYRDPRLTTTPGDSRGLGRSRRRPPRDTAAVPRLPARAEDSAKYDTGGQ